ncbi:hypothetical protein CLOL250_00870 [Clostridium sp. L2-50]|nr:hypothetical protein CLOL250_00870 [Clostridium sp. L2-50]
MRYIFCLFTAERRDKLREYENMRICAGKVVSYGF